MRGSGVPDGGEGGGARFTRRSRRGVATGSTREVTGMWRGAAALCVDDRGRVLLVLGGDERKRWGLPGGGAEAHESLAECYRREVWEETGYRVAIGPELCVKTRSPVLPDEFELHVFEAHLVGGSGKPQDPDGEVETAAWFGIADLPPLQFHFPEDKDLVLHHLRQRG